MWRVRRIPCRLPSRSCARRRSLWLCADICPMAGTRTGPAKSFSELFICSSAACRNVFPSAHHTNDPLHHTINLRTAEQHERQTLHKQYSRGAHLILRSKRTRPQIPHRHTPTNHFSKSLRLTLPIGVFRWLFQALAAPEIKPACFIINLVHSSGRTNT